MRHMRRPRSLSKRRHGYGAAARAKVKVELVSEGEEAENAAGDDGSLGQGRYEFDVHLKVWRNSRANVWRTPSLLGIGGKTS